MTSLVVQWARAVLKNPIFHPCHPNLAYVIPGLVKNDLSRDAHIPLKGLQVRQDVANQNPVQSNLVDSFNNQVHSIVGMRGIDIGFLAKSFPVGLLKSLELGKIGLRVIGTCTDNTLGIIPGKFLHVLLNDSTGHFSYSQAHSLNVLGPSSAIGDELDITDLDGDGVYDVWLGLGGEESHILINSHRICVRAIGEQASIVRLSG